LFKLPDDQFTVLVINGKPGLDPGLKTARQVAHIGESELLQGDCGQGTATVALAVNDDLTRVCGNRTTGSFKLQLAAQDPPGQAKVPGLIFGPGADVQNQEPLTCFQTGML